MIFNILHLEASDPRQVQVISLLNTQGVLCLFDDRHDGIYSFENLLGHDRALITEIRNLDPSATYQVACNEYEQILAKRHANLPTTAQCVKLLLVKDLAERYPSVIDNGFDLGAILLPRRGEQTLLKGGILFCALFPREKPGQQAPLSWPFDSTPCLVTIDVDPEDSAFLGMISSGLHDVFGRAGSALLIDPQEPTAAGRRKKAIAKFLQCYPKIPLYINYRFKHMFLCHVLNVLGSWANNKLGGGIVSKVALSGETEIKLGDSGVVIIQPKPFIQRA